jgi:catechol 2,3-dioxygenase
MPLPKPVYYPPFNITRSSHAVITSRDLEASRDFYEQVIGLVLTERNADTLYFRGLEEVCHHSLVIKRKSDNHEAEAIGFRVYTEEELDKAEHFYRSKGLPARWIEVPHQGRTLLVNDPAGTPVQLCATMTTTPRVYTQFQDFKGGAAMRFDHYQIQVPNVQEQTDFYAEMGFRISEYMALDEKLIATFMFRKPGTQDIVFLENPGPRLHHFAYTVSDSHSILRACDIAGNLGMGDVVERGPGRHGPAGVLFVYLRDPDGHRVELFCDHYLLIDIEVEPVAWDVRKPGLSLRWGLPPQEAWFNETTAFSGIATKELDHERGPLVTLETYLADKARVRAASNK